MKIKEVVPLYLRHLKAIGRADRTILDVGYDMRPFMRFLKEENISSLDELTPEVMAEYQQELAFRVTAKGTLLSLRSQGQLMGVAKGFTRFLKQKDYLLHDPGDKIKLPRKPKTLPKAILNEEEIRRLIAAPDTRNNTGYRNRVILEILYDTAVRRSEISNIKLCDLDLNAGFIRIHGKGNKERVVPLSQRVCALVKNYILAVRPSFVNGRDDGSLIVNRWGKRMGGSGVWAVVKRCALLAGIKKNITTHGLRHTCATHMLKNGAPVRYLQEMLGHESLESTQIYTRVTIADLKKIHARYHPGEKME
jgi:integrase/recombinase XerD